MTTQLVPRFEIMFQSCGTGEYAVTDSDAALLESIVRAADEMRKHSLCDCAGCEVVPGSCALCRAARAYDAARREVKP